MLAMTAGSVFTTAAMEASQVGTQLRQVASNQDFVKAIDKKECSAAQSQLSTRMSATGLSTILVRAPWCEWSRTGRGHTRRCCYVLHVYVDSFEVSGWMRGEHCFMAPTEHTVSDGGYSRPPE